MPKGTLSNCLKPYPLPEDVRQAKQAVGYEKLRDYIQSERKRIRPTESKFHKALGDQQLTHYQRGSIAEAGILPKSKTKNDGISCLSHEAVAQ